LVNKTGVSIHHAINTMPFFPAAFIFDEQRRRWLIAGVFAAD
jgi:hypothetical protein